MKGSAKVHPEIHLIEGGESVVILLEFIIDKLRVGAPDKFGATTRR